MGENEENVDLSEEERGSVIEDTNPTVITDKVVKNSINLESGEPFSFKIIIDP